MSLALQVCGVAVPSVSLKCSCPARLLIVNLIESLVGHSMSTGPVPSITPSQISMIIFFHKVLLEKG